MQGRCRSGHVDGEGRSEHDMHGLRLSGSGREKHWHTDVSRQIRRDDHGRVNTVDERLGSRGVRGDDEYVPALGTFRVFVCVLDPA